MSEEHNRGYQKYHKGIYEYKGSVLSLSSQERGEREVEDVSLGLNARHDSPSEEGGALRSRMENDQTTSACPGRRCAGLPSMDA
jgi:hypothetical protein